MADCCLIKKVATVEVYENKNEVRAYGFMAGDRNTPVMEVRFKHLWGESNLSSCKLRWIIVDDVGSLLVGEVPIQSDNTALINLPNELFTGDRRMKVQLTVASCDGERMLNLQQFTDLKVINSLAPNEVVEPVYQILINAIYDESQKYLKELETSYTQKYGSLDSLYKSARASLEEYLITAENGGNAEFLQGYSPAHFKKVENTINDLITSKKYKVGDVVEVLGYYEKGDGAQHLRKKMPVGYNGADAVIGVDGSIWGLTNSSYVNVRWFGADNFNINDASEQIQRAIDYCRGELHFPTGVYKISKKNFQKSVFEIGHSIKITGTTARYTEILIDDLGEDVNIITLTNKSTDNGIRFLSITDLNIRPVVDYTNGHCVYYRGDTNLEWIAQAEIKRNSFGCFGKEGIYLENVKTSPEWVGYQTGGWCLSIIEDNFIHNGIKLIECGDSNIIRKNVITSASDNIGKNFIGINCKNIFGSSLLVIEDNNITTKGGSIAILEEGLRCKILRNNCELDQVKNMNTNSIILISGNAENTGLSNITIEENSLQDLSYVNDLNSYCDDIISINNAKVIIKNNSILGTSNGIRLSGGIVDQHNNFFNDKIVNRINYNGGLITGYDYKLTNLSSSGDVFVRLLDSFRMMNVYGDFTKNDTGAVFSGVPIQPKQNTTFASIIKRNGYNEVCSILNNQIIVNNDESREGCVINFVTSTGFEIYNDR